MGDAFIGFCGGAVAEIARWFQLREQLHAGLPNWSKSKGYWIVTFLMCVSGGGLVYLYALSDTKMTGILALNIGASAPLLISSLVSSTPAKPGKVD
jgi:hypothetical protein